MYLFAGLDLFLGRLNINTLHNVVAHTAHYSNRMWKTSQTRTGPNILNRTFISNTLKAAASVLNSVHASSIKKHEQDERLVEYQFCRTKEVSVTQLPIETIIATVDKSDLKFHLQTDVIFGGNGGAKVNKFLDCVKSKIK